MSYLILQGWPCTDVDPLTALLTLFAYEKRTGKILTNKQIQDGELRDLLQPEDFENAEKVLAFLYFLFVLIYPVLFYFIFFPLCETSSSNRFAGDTE